LGAFGVVTSPLVFAPVAALFVVVGLVWLRRKGFLKFGRGNKSGRAASVAVVEFYERMTETLKARGHNRRDDETPLEFAGTVNTPEVLTITQAYNRVRFGAQNLSNAEAAEVERCLRRMEEESRES
jgi:hypothetical protein